MTQPEFTLDWPHGWQTRDGRDVVVYCTDAPGPYPIHGRVEGLIASVSWNETGISFYGVGGIEGIGNLINRPAPIVSVPADKLHDAVFSHPTSGGYIVFESSEICAGPYWQNRPIKWFYVDEAEPSK